MDQYFLLRWQDYVDIAILSVIIYRIILMLQGTRTVQIVIGLVIVAATFYLANLLQLGGVSWVLTNLFNSLVLVIVVLFQSDFRNALAQVGTRGFYRDAPGQSPKEIIEKIYKVCEHFSSERIGALIVLEQKMGLGDYAATGTRINAEFSSPLLATIFNKDTPLHDGALIIDRQMKLAYAGCILPLSPDIGLSKKLGTRHRAALGLSEESDAIILVVSEETGAIRLAHQGDLFRGSLEFTVREKLFQLFNIKG